MTRPVNLAGIDLNLLVVLEALLEEMNVTRAGERVGLSQPAVSNTLSRLRHLLDDPLLERDGRHMRLTERAHLIKVPLHKILDDLRSLLDKPQHFDPATAAMDVRIFASDYTTYVTLVELRNSLRQVAPGINIDISWSERARVAELIAHGNVDFAFGSFDNMPSQIRRASLFDDEVVVVARNGHPVLEGELTLERLTSYSRLGVSFHGRDYGPTERAIARAGGNVDCEIVLPHALVGPLSVCETDLVMLTSRRICERLTAWLPIGWRPVPFDLEQVRIELVWSEHSDHDPAMVWFREHLLSLAKTF